MQRGNRIHQRQGFLRVIPVCAGQAYGERDAPPVANQMALASRASQSKSAKWIRSHTLAVLPVAQATPARHPRPAPEFLWEHLPGDAAAKDEDNTCEARAIRSARPSAL
jgi:hypothetical protein